MSEISTDARVRGGLDDRVPLSMGKGLEDRELHCLGVRVLDDGYLH